ncbi:sodium:proton antiporter, partial [bacterium]|nr:sodium:proton antiporter [bacterium]
ALAPRERRREIHWEPLSEVAIVFAGVFATVTPVLELVRAHGPDLPLGTPARDFLIAGALSSVLDNAPTYLVLVEGAASANRSLAQPLAGVGTTGVPESVLAAISCGCVLMGANTYIGNGPNLLVRAMAEKDGVAMPGFFRFLGWSVLVLGPIYAAIVVVFFR